MFGFFLAVPACRSQLLPPLSTIDSTEDAGVTPRCIGKGFGFEAPAAHRVPGRAVQVVAVDLNRDGQADLAAASDDERGDAILVSVLLSGPGGRFGSPVIQALGLPPKLTPCALAAGDIDGDGRRDLAVAATARPTSEDPWPNNFVVALRGDASGGLHPIGDPYTTGRIERCLSLAVVDSDQDGSDDIVLSESGNLTLVTSFAGARSAHHERWYALLGGGGLGSLTAGDFTGDGHLDLAAIGNANQRDVILLPAFAMGDFRWQRLPPFAQNGYHTQALALRPWVRQDDPRLSLAALTARLDERPGSSVYELWLLLPVDGGLRPDPAPKEVARSLELGFEMEMGDLDCDGHQDVIVAAGKERAIHIFPGRADGQLGAVVTLPVQEPPKSLVVADLDGDGRDDVGWISSDSSIVTVRSAGQ